jgi:uncharacterized protein YxeA
VIPPLFIAVIVVVAVVVVAGFYLYKKMKVESDEGTPYFEPAYGSG